MDRRKNKRIREDGSLRIWNIYFIFVKRVEIFFPGFGKARFGNRDRMAENVINCGEN